MTGRWLGERGVRVLIVVEVEDGGQKDWLMRPLMRTALVAAKVVEALQPFLPCSFRRHRARNWSCVTGWL
jgi:hypothetical protein